MKTYFDCIPCFIRQTLDAVRLVTDNQEIHEQVLREVLILVSKMDLNMTPPAMAQKIHRVIKQLVKTDDPYKQAKQRFNKFALELFPKFQNLVDSSEKPFETAVRLAIAGNIIDLGVKCSLSIEEAEMIIEQTLTDPFDMEDFENFKRSVTQTQSYLNYRRLL